MRVCTCALEVVVLASEVVAILGRNIARDGDGPVHMIVDSRIGPLETIATDTSDRTSYTFEDELPPE